MSRVVTEPAPSLPANLSFSDEFRSFVDLWYALPEWSFSISHESLFLLSSSLIKDYKQRPKYVQLMLQPFFIRARDATVDVAGWYRQVTHGKVQH